MAGITVDRSVIERMTSHRGQGGRVSRSAAEDVRDQAQQVIRSAGRVDSGRMVASLNITQARTSSGRFAAGWELTADVPYAVFQHEGRGPVFPVQAQVLRFRPKGSDVFIFRPRAGPDPGLPFFTIAMRQVTV